MGGLPPPPPMQTPLLDADADPPDADLPGDVTCDVCWEANPPPVEQNERQV